MDDKSFSPLGVTANATPILAGAIAAGSGDQRYLLIGAIVSGLMTALNAWIRGYYDAKAARLESDLSHANQEIERLRREPTARG